MSDAGQELLVERDEGLAILRLNRPERMNALAPGLLQLLADEVPRIVDAPDVRAILITGVGRAFCAGGDVGSMAGAPDRDATLAGMKATHPWLNALWATDKTVVTAVNGPAAGAGFGLAMIGDWILASEDAVFKGGFTTLGAVPDYGLGFTLPRAVGAVRAAEIVFSDRRVTAREALDMGMVSQVLPAEGFAAVALEFARGVAKLPRGAQLTRRLLRLDAVDTFARYLAAEAEAQTEAFQSEDFAEGVAAFREKRGAEFKGR